jgi:hypothetical protein
MLNAKSELNSVTSHKVILDFEIDLDLKLKAIDFVKNKFT